MQTIEKIKEKIKEENQIFIFESGFIACSKCAEGCTERGEIQGVKKIIDASVDGSFWECENCPTTFNSAANILYRVGDMEPTCPNCGNANAMLPEMDGVPILKCRDCGHAVREGEYAIKQIKRMIKKDDPEFEALKKAGRVNCSDIPGVFYVEDVENFDVCGAPADEYLSSKLDELIGCREDILQKLDEMESILRDVADQTENRMMLTRVRAYWLPTVRGCLDFVGTASMIPLDDTIKEIKGESA